MDKPLDALRPFLWDGYTGNWTPRRWQLLEDLAAGRRTGGRGEEAVTDALVALGGEPGKILARILLQAVGVQPRPQAEMASPGDRSLIRKNGTRSPDMFIADLETEEVLLAIEGKGGAAVNGGWGYCPENPDGYSNQIICYPHRCWADGGVDEATRYLWVHPLSKQPQNVGIQEEWAHDPDWTLNDPALARELTSAYSRQQQAWQASWRTFTWEQLCRELLVVAHPATDVMARIIATWCSTRPLSVDRAAL